MNSKGEKIEYTVKEKEIEGYTSEIEGNQEEGYTITNTPEVKKEVLGESEAPTTLDSIIKYMKIAAISILLLTLFITIYLKRKKEA